MIKGNKGKPPPTNNREILRVCIQSYSYHDRRNSETSFSVGELYHKIFGNNNEVAKALNDYVFTHKDEI